jgi:hypothetical protein
MCLSCDRRLESLCAARGVSHQRDSNPARSGETADATRRPEALPKECAKQKRERPALAFAEN